MESNLLTVSWFELYHIYCTVEQGVREEHKQVFSEKSLTKSWDDRCKQAGKLPYNAMARQGDAYPQRSRWHNSMTVEAQV